jgi:VanW like protein
MVSSERSQYLSPFHSKNEKTQPQPVIARLTYGVDATARQKRKLPSRGSALSFLAKSTLLKLQRAAKNLQAKTPALAFTKEPFQHILAENRTPLWTDESQSEKAFQLGKVHNLRVAIKNLDGLLIPAGATFSFWKQVGKATKKKGYVYGRQLREGCLYPEIGGGICQLSNALYAVALDARCQILERHGHSQIIPGSAAEHDKDATVAWNYIDLRFSPATDVVLEAKLTEKELIVSLRSKQPIRKLIPLKLAGSSRNRIKSDEHSCPSCGETSCFRHKSIAYLPQLTGDEKSAFIVDEVWPEFQAWIASSHTDQDCLITPIDGDRWRQPQYAWNVVGFDSVRHATTQTLLRAYRSRKVSRYGAARLKSQLESTERMAATLASQIPFDSRHLVIAQSYLPFFFKEGHLGGRTYDVLATRLPLHNLQARLDEEALKHPERKTLSEFRAPSWLVEMELEAYEGAKRIISPNAELVQLAGDRGVLLPWNLPQPRSHTPGKSIAFPGPTAARKGCYELREVARELDLEIVLLGSELEGTDFWQGVKTRRVVSGENWLDGVCAVVQPALVEERPRRLLQAIASGVPVICSPACGLGDIEGYERVAFGDVAALRERVMGKRVMGNG